MAASIAFVLLLCRADVAQARSVRHSVNLVLEKYPASRYNVWFEGHWGFQYYMEAAGAKAVDFSHLQLKSGDVVVIPINNTNLKTLDGIELVSALKTPVASSIALMNAALAPDITPANGERFRFVCFVRLRK